jgi:hypothetical protein
VSADNVDDRSTKIRLGTVGPQVDRFPVVYFESYSLLRTLVLWRQVRQAGTILFFRPSAGGPKETVNKTLVRRCIGLLNRTAGVRELDMSELLAVKYSSNLEGVALAAALGASLHTTRPYHVLRKVVGDDHIDRYYKASLAMSLGQSVLFAKTADALLAEAGAVLVVPDEPAVTGPHMAVATLASDAGPLARLPRTNRVLAVLQTSTWALVGLCLPLGVFTRELLAHGVTRPAKRVYEVAVPVLHGVFKDGDHNVRAGVRRTTDDRYLYGDHFRAGDILHVFFPSWMRWRRTEEDYWKEAMTELGLAHADAGRFGVTGALLRVCLGATCRMLAGLAASGAPVASAPAVWRATVKGIYHYVKKHQELENISYKVELVRDDYNPAHVIDTIVANQRGRKRVGVSHAAAPFDAPQLCFVHFDRYAVYCHLYVRTFSPHWDAVRLEKVGRDSIDALVEQKRKRPQIAAKIASLYATRRWTVTVLFPGYGDVCVRGQWDNIFRAFEQFRDVDLDCHVFFRFRRMDKVREYPHMSRFLDLATDDPRIHVDHDNFGTQELMVASDLVITANASFGINEALVADVRVFTFAYLGVEHLYFPDYGQDFVMSESSDVLRAFQGLQGGFDQFDCDWERLRRDADYFHDGQNAGRLAAVVADTITEASQARVAAR